MRLEQQNSYLRTFNSTVLKLRKEPNHTLVALSQSAFYPSSGGQSFDTGTLNGHAVVDVFKDAKQDKTVWHKLEAFPFELGDTVQGVIDWGRRYKHMQRHTAEHMLAQAFVRLNPAFETHAVNMAQKVCTLDIAGQPSHTDITRAEETVNHIAYQNLRVTTFELDESELGDYPLRRAPKVSGRIRIVQIGDYDLSACGGTHLQTSSEALPIKVIGFEKIKGQLTRMYFMAGQEALEDYQLKHSMSTQLAQSFSSTVQQLPERIKQLREELKVTKAQLASLQEHLADTLADNLLQQAHVSTKGRVITHVLEASQADLLQPLSRALGKHPDVIALLGAVSDKAALLFMRGKSVNLSMNTLLAEVLYLIKGKGGGNPERAQGQGSDTTGVMQALEHARLLLNEQD